MINSRACGPRCGGGNGTRIRRASAVNGTTKQVCFNRPQPNVDLVAWLSGCGSQTAPRVPRQPDDQTTRALVAWSSVCLVAGAQRPEKITHSQTTRRPDDQGAGHPVGWLREPTRLPTARRPDNQTTRRPWPWSSGRLVAGARRPDEFRNNQTTRPGGQALRCLVVQSSGCGSPATEGVVRSR